MALVGAVILLSFLISVILLCGGVRRSRRGHLPLPPGPKGWPVLGNLLQVGPNLHQTLYNLSEIHGPILYLRLGSVDFIIVNSVAAAEKMLRIDLKFSNRPSSLVTEHFAYKQQDMVFTPYGPRWRMLRKLCAIHLFSNKAMEVVRPVRTEELTGLVQNLSRNSSSFVDLNKEIHACATNAISRVLVGRRVFEAGDQAQEFKGMIEELMILSGSVNIGDFVHVLRWLDLHGLVAKMKKFHQRFDNFLERLIEEHRAGLTETGSANSDMLSVLIKLANSQGNGDVVAFTDADIKPLLQNLFIAGTDTSSNTVEFAIAELIRQPKLLARAQQEMDDVVGRGRLVTEEDLPNLPFLKAVVKETFRCHPAAPLSLPRLVTEDFEVDGYLIPRGATLHLNIWAIGRDQNAWPDDPLAFRPDRFLPGGRHVGVDVMGNDFELIPFGGGRRICAGLNLGLLMVQLLTATLVQAFQWELPEGQLPQELDMKLKFGLTLHRTVPLLVRPIPRLDPVVYL